MTNRDTWDHYYKTLDNVWAWKESSDPFLASQLRALRSRSSDARVLEVGCGDGRNVSTLCDFFPGRVWIQDISVEAIRNLRDRLPPDVLSSCADIAVSTVYDLGYSAEYFDAVVATLFFDHLDNLDSALKEIVRVTKSSGVLIAQFSALDDDAFAISKPVSSDGRRRQLHGIPYVFFSKQDVMNLLSPHFSEIEIAPLVVVDPPHPGWREVEHTHSYWIVVAANQ